MIKSKGKLDKGKKVVTVQTRLPRDLPVEDRQILNAYAAHFSRLEHIMLMQSNRNTEFSKKDFMAEHGLTGRQYNALKRSLDGKIDSQLSNLENHIQRDLGELVRKQDELDKKRKQFATLKNAIAADGENPGKLTTEERVKKERQRDKLRQKIAGVNRRIQILTSRIQSQHNQLQDKKPRICFGSRKLFRKQFNLKENKYKSHKKWLDDWQVARSKQFFVLGSKDENAGCQGCVISEAEDGSYTLKLRLPNAVAAEVGQRHLTIHNIRFSYNKEYLQHAMLENQLRKEKESAFNKNPVPGVTVNQHLANYGQALSYRFDRDEKGWRVLVSVEAPPREVITSRNYGGIGVDFNNHHFAVCSIDHRGNKEEAFDTVFRKGYDMSSAQNLTQIQEAAKQIVELAKKTQRPIIIEDLDFRLKKRNLTTGDSRYNQMISSLVYRKARQAIERRAYREGVEVIAVNPAYTSFIGKMKYLSQTGQNGHQAAALVIARGGLGYRERLPKQATIMFRSGKRLFDLPEDKSGEQLFAHCRRAAKAFGGWYKAQIGELRSATQVVVQQRLLVRQDREDPLLF